MNLGWKLAQVVKGIAPETMLDTYHAERHLIAPRVLRDTMAQVALLRTDDRTNALREIMASILPTEQPRKRIAGMMSGLDVHYGPEGGHPVLGPVAAPRAVLIRPDQDGLSRRRASRRGPWSRKRVHCVSFGFHPPDPRML